MEGLFFGFLIFIIYSLVLYTGTGKDYNSLFFFVEEEFPGLLISAFIGFMIFMLWNL